MLFSGLRRASFLEMIPENTPEQPLPPRRLVQLPNNLNGSCQEQNGECEKKKEDKTEEEIVSDGC